MDHKFCLSSISFIITNFWFLLLLFIFSGCNVGGNTGDSTQQGTCQEANQVCVSDGTCAGMDLTELP